ncbi:MAG TPA: DUF4129 domain-containing protein [Agromyces mariniharenae]|nr:DUF4129 domain-containing protein [Agromyces mariniharenae]
MVLNPRLEIPLDPDAPEARRWVVDELSNPEYASAEPTPFDLAMQAIRDWIASLFEGATGVPGPLLALLAVLVVAVLLVVGLLVFGLPRLRRRRRAVAPLFDDHDRRDLPTLRRAAEAAAAREEWALAIEERFRAIVRGVVDRDLVRVHPGTTAHGFADAASRPLPAHAEALRTAAADFDAVRYLGRAGSRERYEAIVGLDLAVEATVPEHAEPVGAGA